MFSVLRYIISTACITLAVLSGWTQDLPALYPVAWTAYGILEGLPDPCVESAFVTREGRLVLIGCNFVRQAHGLDVYVFDGKRAYPSALSQKRESQGM
jgi:hypothetical protein